MALQSQLFRGDPKLAAAAVSDPAHIVRGARGPHVGKIQSALNQIDGAGLDQDSIYGPLTAGAVRSFKRDRQILNFQGQIDDIVGKKTVAALDEEMVAVERGGGGGGGGLLLNLKFGVITHTLAFFSGVADDKGNGGVRLKDTSHGEEVFTDMQNLDVLPDVKDVFGFGGSLANKRQGVDQAVALIEQRDPNGELIIYGFSAGGINSMDLCRALLKKGVKVNLLVLVDASGRGETVDRMIPTNVVHTRNYFQTAVLTTTRARGDKATGGGGLVTNIDCDDRNFDLLTLKSRHSQMEGLTKFEAIRDMRVHIRRLQATR